MKMQKMRVVVLAIGFVMAFELATARTCAMYIADYDRMSVGNRDNFIDLLLNGVIDQLNATKRSDDANAVIKLFTPGSDGHSKGGDDFLLNLKILHDLDKKGITDNNGNTIHPMVEDALALTLTDAGIKVDGKKLVDIGNKFVPDKGTAATQPSTEPAK
jgi:hypothetical protein